MYNVKKLRLEYYIYLAKKLNNELKKRGIVDILRIRSTNV